MQAMATDIAFPPTDTGADLIYRLRDLGKRSAAQWLDRKLPNVGVVSSINIARDYLDDMRVPVSR